MARTLIIILLLFGTGAGGIFYLRPAWQEFNAARQETNYLASVSGELDDLLKSRDTLLAAVNSISKEDLGKIDLALPQGQHAAEFLVMLERTTLRNGLLLKQIDLSGTFQKGASSSGSEVSKSQPKPSSVQTTVESEKPFKELPITMTVSGSYESFKTFLRELEQHVRLIEVESISFNAPPESSQVIEFNIKLKTFYQ